MCAESGLCATEGAKLAKLAFAPIKNDEAGNKAAAEHQKLNFLHLAS
jgi:hypothetical protein